ncbi:hypothetical protein [Marinicellulosiphila megalodicopiae]|uniref:hypothetical protein n=1 Tax=Marinicellulosiphila megalodicopiae TaxID=2724896 RepID=UPI003BAFF1B7
MLELKIEDLENISGGYSSGYSSSGSSGTSSHRHKFIIYEKRYYTGKGYGVILGTCATEQAAGRIKVTASQTNFNTAWSNRSYFS